VIELMMWLAWILPGLATYRRVGYAIESRVTGNCEFTSICAACKCRNCGQPASYHDNGPSRKPTPEWQVVRCQFEPTAMPHFRTMVALPLVMLTYPLIILGWAGNAVRKHYGMELYGFWKPAPQIESRKDKWAREMRELEEENARLEKELEIGRS
jgi:hypothetical protein